MAANTRIRTEKNVRTTPQTQEALRQLRGRINAARTGPDVSFDVVVAVLVRLAKTADPRQLQALADEVLAEYATMAAEAPPIRRPRRALPAVAA